MPIKMDELPTDNDLDEKISEFTLLNERLGECEVCGTHAARYTCPKCEVKTCRLKCVNIHKTELACDGIRDVARFIQIKRFTNLDMLSDFRFLEEVSRTAYTNKKMLYCKENVPNLPLHLCRLRSAAHRRDTLLMFLPKEFTRHRGNTTYLDWKTQMIHWHVEWVFVNAEGGKLTRSDKVLETEKIGLILDKYFDPSLNENVINQKLKFYQSTGLSRTNVKMFLKAEGVPGNQFYELDPAHSVRECLVRRVLIEYPIVHVVLKDMSLGYKIIDDESFPSLPPSFDVNSQLTSNIMHFQKSRKRKRNKNFLIVEHSSDESSE